MPRIPEIQENVATTLALLENLVYERFSYYTKCCESALDNIGSAEALWKMYVSTIRRSYLPIALMASRLQSIESFIVHLHNWTKEWLVKSQNRQKDIFDSFLTISGGSMPKAPLGSCLFVCHLCDTLSYCRSTDRLNGLSLEHYFAFLQYELSSKSNCIVKCVKRKGQNACPFSPILHSTSTNYVLILSTLPSQTSSVNPF